MQVAYQGEPGAYSERAVRSLFPHADPMPCETVRLVFSRVTSGEADHGVVPLENSQAGSVNETYDQLQHTSLLHIVGEVLVRVDHALLGVSGARLEQVRRAHSPLAGARPVRGVPVVDAHRAGARARHGRGRTPGRSAGRSRGRGDREREAGAALGLAVLAERIQTEKENFTKFAAISTRAPDLGAADKTSLVMAVRDRPGSLLASLQPFAEREINLHKLESRPRRGKPFEYVFYVDLTAPVDAPRGGRRARPSRRAHLAPPRAGQLPVGGRAGLTGYPGGFLAADTMGRMAQDDRSFRPSRRSVGIAAGVVSALMVATVGWALVRGGDDGGSTGAAPPASVSVRTPKPANRAVRGVTTFRGNATRSYYGRGPVPLDPVVRWRHPEVTKLCSESIVGVDVTEWCGTGWTGQPNVIEVPGGGVEVREGAYDGRYHFVDGETGEPVRPPARHAGPREGIGDDRSRRLPPLLRGLPRRAPRVVALDRDEPETLGASMGERAPRGLSATTTGTVRRS